MPELENNRPVCPDCGHKMMKAGHKWSGKINRQKYQCNNFGRCLIVGLFENKKEVI